MLVLVFVWECLCGRGHCWERLGQSALVPSTQLLKCLKLPQRQEHPLYTNEMTSGQRVLNSFRIVTGHQDNPGMIRGLKLLAPLSNLQGGKVGARYGVNYQRPVVHSTMSM